MEEPCCKRNGGRTSSSSSSPEAVEDSFFRVPISVVESIISLLDVKSLCAVASTCHILRDSVRSVLQACRSLDLVDVHPSTEDLGRLLADNCSIASLSIDCRNMTDSAITFLTRPSLQELSLSNCHRFSPDLLTGIGKNCSTLRLLSLEDFGFVEAGSGGYDEALIELLEHSNCIEDLAILDCNPFSSRALSVIPRELGHTLRSLTLRHVSDVDASLIVTGIGSNLNRGYGGGMAGYGRMGGLLGNREGASSAVAAGGPQKGWSWGFGRLQRLSLLVWLINDRLVLAIARYLPMLESLELQDEPAREPGIASDLTDWGVMELGRACKRLRHLAIVRSGHACPVSFGMVNDVALIVLAVALSTCLETILLEGFSRITDAGIVAVFENCSNLKSASFPSTSRMTDLSFVNLPAKPRRLASVNVSMCRLVTNQAMDCIALACKESLTELNLSRCESVGDAGVAALSDLTCLRKLTLNYTEVGDRGLMYLGSGSVPLESLSVRGCKAISNKGVYRLFAVRRREAFSPSSSTNQTSQGGKTWGMLSRSLRILDLSSLPNISDRSVATIAQSGVRLQELKLRECFSVRDKAVALIAQAVDGPGGSLVSLDLCRCWDMTNACLKWFMAPYFPSLRYLGIGFAESMKEIVKLARCRPWIRLTRFDIQLTEYGDDYDDAVYDVDLEEGSNRGEMEPGESSLVRDASKRAVWGQAEGVGEPYKRGAKSMAMANRRVWSDVKMDGCEESEQEEEEEGGDEAVEDTGHDAKDGLVGDGVSHEAVDEKREVDHRDKVLTEEEWDGEGDREDTQKACKLWRHPENVCVSEGSRKRRQRKRKRKRKIQEGRALVEEQ